MVTVVNAIPRVLNNHQSYDTFQSRRPGDASALMSMLSVDIDRYNHSVIMHVLTATLARYNGHKASHLVVGNGYDHRGGGFVTITDSNCPPCRGVNSYPAGNPSGQYTEKLGDVYTAVKNSNSKLVVW